MSGTPNINVWTLGNGSNGRWKLQLSTSDVGKAIDRVEELVAEGKQVALYELGSFEHEGQQVSGYVGFWWTEGLNAYMEREPEDRGVGWSDDHDTWVTYTYPGEPASALPAVSEAQLPAAVEEAAEPAQRYVEADCDHCGIVLPMYQLRRYTHEVRTGRSSGTSRSYQSHSSGFSGRSFSSRSSSGTGFSSGRRYYKTETLLLCETCYAAQAKSDDTPLNAIIRFFTRLD